MESVVMIQDRDPERSPAAVPPIWHSGCNAAGASDRVQREVGSLGLDVSGDFDPPLKSPLFAFPPPRPNPHSPRFDHRLRVPVLLPRIRASSLSESSRPDAAAAINASRTT